MTAIASSAPAAAETMVLTYRARLQPRKRQRRALENILELDRQLWNGALEHRIGGYEKSFLPDEAAVLGYAKKLRKTADKALEKAIADGAADIDAKFTHAGAVQSIPALVEIYRSAKQRYVTESMQSAALTIIRAEMPEYAAYQRRIQRNRLTSLDLAFKSFYRRAKEGAGASSGFPKFKARAQSAGQQHLTGFGCEGFGFDAPQQIKFEGRRLRFSGMHRGLCVSKRDMKRVPPLDGIVKNAKGEDVPAWKGVDFKRTRAGWQVTFQVATKIAGARIGCGEGQVGVDWGTHYLATLSTGEMEHNPRPREELASALLVRERKVARRQRGSKRRLKARAQKQAVEQKIANRRRNRMDKLSQRLVTHYAFVAVEDIAVKTMMNAERPGETLPQFVKTRRNREALDAAPSMLRQMIVYKGVRARAEVVAVDPKHNSAECFWCGGLHFKELTDAMHTCTRPGLYFGKTVPRQINSARVNLRRALSLIAGPGAAAPPARGSDDGGGQAPAGGGKPPNRSTGSGRPKNARGGRDAGACALRSGQAGLPQLSARTRAKDPRLRPLV